MNPPQQNTETELEAFVDVCSRLSGFDERVSPDWVDGYMTALHAGPRAISPNEWMPVMLGDAFERAFADPQDAEQATNTLVTRWKVIGDQLNPERLLEDENALHLSPLISVWSDEDKQRLIDEGHLTAEEAGLWPATGEVWALGFLDATEDFAGDWAAPNEHTDEGRYFESCLSQIVALTFDEDGDELTEHMENMYPGKTLSRDELIDEACYAVQDLRVFWLDHAPKPATRHIKPGPGRNDLCSCGSGKKYKKCHGVS